MAHISYTMSTHVHGITITCTIHLLFHSHYFHMQEEMKIILMKTYCMQISCMLKI